MRTKQPLQPAHIPIIKELIQFLADELGSDFLAQYDGWGWNVYCDDFDGIYNPVHESMFAGARKAFPEVRFTFAFIGKEGFDSMFNSGTLCGVKNFTIRLKERRAS